jgi:methyl-accepting chemotaxis protein
MKQLIAQFQLGGANTGVADTAALRHVASAMARPSPRSAAYAPATHGNAAVKQEWSEF